VALGRRGYPYGAPFAFCAHWQTVVS